MSEVAEKSIDVRKKALELAKILKEQPNLIEKGLASRGQGLVAVYSDSNFKNSFQNLREMKIEAMLMAIDDLGGGSVTLRASTVGITFLENRIQTFISPHGQYPKGTVMFSVALKSQVAFKGYRSGEGDDEMSEETAQACMYYLITELAQIIQ